MKAGDTVPITMGEWHVADAVVKEVDMEEKKIYLEIPATTIVTGLDVNFAELPDDPNAKEHLLLGPEDQARAELEAAGIELDEDDDYVAPAQQGGSLKDLDLDGLD